VFTRANDSATLITLRSTEATAVALRWLLDCHVEHLLPLLEAPTRTLAAIRAEREGCYVPPPPGALRARRR
jgi:hypothetical protein